MNFDTAPKTFSGSSPRRYGLILMAIAAAMIALPFLSPILDPFGMLGMALFAIGAVFVVGDFLRRAHR